MLLLVVAAALGVFGTGPLSDTTATQAESGLEVRYPRFLRYQSVSSLEVIARPAEGSDEVVVWLDRDYLALLVPDRITPEPSDVTFDGERLRYSFASEDGAPATVIFELEPERPGIVTGRIGSGDSGGVKVWHLVYP